MRKVVISYLMNDRYSRAAKKVAKSTRKIKQEMMGAAKATGRFNMSAEKFRKGAAKSGQVARRAALAAAGGVASLVTAYTSFDDALVRVKSLMDKTEILKHGKDLRKIGQDAAKAGMGFQDFGDAMFEAKSVLGEFKLSREMFEAAHGLAKGGATTTMAAVGGMVGAYRGYELPPAYIAEAFYTAQLKGRTDVAGISQTFGRYGKGGRILGMDLPQVLGLFAAISQQAGGPSMASTETAALLRTLEKTPLDPKRRMMLQRAMGIRGRLDVSAIRGAPGGAIGVIGNMVEYFRDPTKNMSLAIEDSEARKALQGLIIGNTLRIVEETQEAIARNWAYKGPDPQSGLRFAIAQKEISPGYQLGMIWGNLKLIAATLGESLNPALKNTADWLEKLSTTIIDMRSAKKELVDTVSSIKAVALGAVALGVPFVLLASYFSPVILAVAVFAAKMYILYEVTKMLIELLPSLINSLGLWLKEVSHGLAGWGEVESEPSTVDKISDLISRIEMGITVNAPRGVIGGMDVFGGRDVNLKVGRAMRETGSSGGYY